MAYDFMCLAWLLIGFSCQSNNKAATGGIYEQTFSLQLVLQQSESQNLRCVLGSRCILRSFSDRGAFDRCLGTICISGADIYSLCRCWACLAFTL